MFENVLVFLLFAANKDISHCAENKNSTGRNLHASQHTVIKERPTGVDILNGLSTDINEKGKETNGFQCNKDNHALCAYSAKA